MNEEDQGPQFTDEEIINILHEFDWNWYLAADYLNCDPKEIKEKFEKKQPNTNFPQKNPAVFDGAQINPENLAKLQNFVREQLKGPLPLLFDDEITNERKSAIASDVLLEMGLPYRLSHMKEYVETYEVLEKEALSLAQWREQNQYLTLIEETLFKISARLVHAEQETAQGNENENNNNNNNNNNDDDSKDLDDENQDGDGFL